MATKEKQIQNAIVQAIFAWGGWATSVQSGAVNKMYTKKDGTTKWHKITMARQGTPDILACINGHFVAIEVKRDQREVSQWLTCRDVHSQIQHGEADLITEAGGFAFITCSLEDLQIDLKTFNIL